MTKRLLFVLIILLVSTALFAAMNGKITPHPTSIDLEWSEVSGTTYYDIYNGETFVVRLDSTSRNYTVKGLDSKTNYTFAIAARDASNNTLDATWLSGLTTTWDGVYYWKNLTSEDNDGKVKDIKIRIEAVKSEKYGQYNNVYLYVGDQEVSIFPLFPFDSQEAKEWHKYKEESIGANAYRVNSGLFNTSSMTPSRWRIVRIELDRDYTRAVIKTSVLSMNFDSESSYELYEEDGKRYLKFQTESNQFMVNSFIFKNPNPNEGDAFILEAIEA